MVKLLPMPKTNRRQQPVESKSYFERLQFDPRLLKSWVTRFIGNFRIVLLLIITICLVGGVSYFNLPKRLNPEVEIPIVSIVTVLPGASPEDVESLISIPLENHLQSVKGLDTITSSSRDNISIMALQFESSVDRDQALNDTQSLVDTFTELPEDAQTPNVSALDFENQPIWTFAKGDERSLLAFSHELKKRLEELPKVDRVLTNGFEEQEVSIVVAPEKLQQYGINPLQLSQLMKQGLASFPAGTLETDGNTFSVTISPSIDTIEDIRNIVLNLQGRTIRLGELATVEERAKPKQATTYFASKEHGPQRAVTFYIYKTSAVSIDEAGQEVEAEVESFFEDKKDQFTLTSLSNTSEQIGEQFTDLLHEFRSTILLVFACIFLFLGLRQALISSLTVPLTFLSAFFFMSVFGMSINFLSLFAFLLALGLLVDDTIVVIQAMTSYYKTGKFTPLQTGLMVWKDTIIPIWSTTLTTIWSFVPLLLTSGIIGEFIKPIPVVVTVTMISSTAIAVLITLPIMIVILKPEIPDRVKLMGKIILALIPVMILLWLSVSFARDLALEPGKLVLFLITFALAYVICLLSLITLLRRVWRSAIEYFQSHTGLQKLTLRAQRYVDHGVINIEPFAEWYHRVIIRVISSRWNRWQVILGTIVYAVVAFGLLRAGLVKNEFFPKSDQEIVYANLELPAGTTMATTEDKTLSLLDTLRHHAESEYVVAEVGKSASGDFSGGSQDSGNSAMFTFHLPKLEERSKTSFQIADDLRKEFQQYQEGKISIVELSGGPPAGADLQINLFGPNLDQLGTYADQLVEYLQSQPGVTNAQKSIKTGTSQVKFVPDKTKLADAGLSVDSLGLWMRIYASGFTLDSINLDKTQQEETDIIFRLDTDSSTLEGLSKVTVVNPMGVGYPLLSLGTLEAQPNPTVINREDGSRTITVTAAVGKGYNVAEKNQELEAFADSLKMQSGYSWTTGGVNEENQKSINSILQAMGVSAILILVTMVIQFGSFRQAFIVLIVIPLAVSSVFIIFALTGTPLSFPALIGVLSLFGIVVTNSMFIVDKINLNKAEGMPLKEAIADAGSSRLEPILLTKLCTVFGLLPITIADPLWRGLGGAIISGILISSTIMLLFIPALYYSIFQSEDTEKLTVIRGEVPQRRRKK
jgi:multidrug efflux pump subunit AcrB